ncbi:transmembrane protein, putative (macronuclear) [Tetrahymena thermophila SB210]|uniref:Transmembrane protein, putative n=1 Tax=Tetrahymena thermophila (strain SB210) TaxID=312017 RepID=W7XD37_TETTS|nr:transmembrane protein, putative [Tetrahymena thermophila SB210]EWS74523.1 transmembrane protein, putative [Tetrahymena thermophila SB210]|eukprot:XP_012652953.1 transmembrane protein, putative [Tetrahymena thermophila SB210]
MNSNFYQCQNYYNLSAKGDGLLILVCFYQIFTFLHVSLLKKFTNQSQNKFTNLKQIASYNKQIYKQIFLKCKLLKKKKIKHKNKQYLFVIKQKIGQAKFLYFLYFQQLLSIEFNKFIKFQQRLICCCQEILKCVNSPLQSLLKKVQCKEGNQNYKSDAIIKQVQNQ